MRILRFLLLCAGAALLAGVVAGHLNRLHPAFDSIGHFRLHLAALGVLTGLLLVALRSLIGGAGLAIASALSLFVTIWPAMTAGEAVASGGPSATYRLLQANLRFDNQTPEDFIRLLGETRPDVATVEEIPDMWVRRLESVKAAYPFQRICPGRTKVGGVAIVSRRPFAEGGAAFCDRHGAVAAQTVDFGGQQVTISAVHLEWPWPKLQPQQLNWLKPLFNEIRGSGGPVLIGGDMNATPWSAALETIAAETGTLTLPQAWGTWIFNGLPKGLAPWLGLPIDNILAGGGVSLVSAKTLRAIGSDHRPILVEFTLQPGA